MPGDPDRGVGDAGPPRSAHRVTDDDARPRPRAGRAAAGAAARRTASGSSGSRASSLRRDVRLVDPGGGQHQPVPGLDDAAGRPRRATTRTVSASMASCRAASRASGSAVSRTISRPSTFDTALEVTTRTSPSCSGGACSAMAAARSSPGRSSPMPVTGRISIRCAAWSAGVTASPVGQLQRGAHHGRGGVVVGHHQRDRTTSTPGTSAAVGVVDEPAVEQAAVGRGRRSGGRRPRR